MSDNTYVRAIRYENFMCRAFGTYDRRKPGLDISYMRNLIDAENGESWVSHLPSADKQLIKIKLYIDKAFDKFIAKRKTDEKKFPLIILKQKAQNSYDSEELLSIINQALMLTQDLK